jgi:hypothetical protein
MNNDIEPVKKYSIGKTALKATPPFIVILIVNAAKAALQQAGITIDDQTLFTIGLAGYGGYVALMNWIKNRKK